MPDYTHSTLLTSEGRLPGQRICISIKTWKNNNIYTYIYNGRWLGRLIKKINMYCVHCLLSRSIVLYSHRPQFLIASSWEAQTVGCITCLQVHQGNQKQIVIVKSNSI